MSETDDTAKRPRHLAAFCVIRPGDYFFSGSTARARGNYVPRYTCPACGCQTRIPENYLGGGKLVCTGDRFWRPHEQNMKKMRREDIISLIDNVA